MPDGETQITAADAKYPPIIVAAINEVMKKVTYVQKGATNNFQNYKYASDGDILRQVQPAMAAAGLVFFQDELRREVIADGTLMGVTYAFTLAHTIGAVWPIQYHRTGVCRLRSEKGAYDDKVVNKCQTAARKYFILGLFLIPTGDDEDPDAHDGEAKDKAKTKPATVDTSPPPQVKAKAEAKRNFEPPPAEQPAIKKWCDEKFDHIAQITHVDRLLELENDPEFTQAMDRLQYKWAQQFNRLRTLIKEKYVELEPANA